MLSNMRDHLLALEEITRFLANQNYDEAAEVAENRLGMSSLELHGASHLGQFMPQEMGAIGTKMHRAASRFALAAKDAELDGGLNKAFSALAEVMQQCVACHAGYKVH
jgi:mono/diheme cytochrome c family protein